MNMARLFDAALEMLVLRTLSSGSRNADQVILEMQRSSGEPLLFGKDELYPVLYRLEQKAFIDGVWPRGTPGLGLPDYSLTARGAALLEQNLAGWNRYVELVERMLQREAAPQRF